MTKYIDHMNISDAILVIIVIMCFFVFFCFFVLSCFDFLLCQWELWSHDCARVSFCVFVSRTELSACESRCAALRRLVQTLQTEMLQLYSQVHLEAHR